MIVSANISFCVLIKLFNKSKFMSVGKAQFTSDKENTVKRGYNFLGINPYKNLYMCKC